VAVVPYSSLLALALGSLLNLFYGGRWTLPIAAWLAPALLLHFARAQTWPAGIAWLYLALFGTTAWAYHGLIPAPGWASVGISALIALASLLPFAVDKLLAPTIPGFASTLVFPLAWAVIDFAAARLSPYGTWGSPAYTQHGNLPLVQLGALTGTVGITFFIAWFPAVVNWAWGARFDWEVVRAGLLLYGTVFVVVLMWGGARLVFSPPPMASARIAAIGWPEQLASRPEYLRAFDPALPSDERQGLSRKFEHIHQYFFDATRREALAGAQLVVWPEANAMLFAEDEAGFLDRARQLARQQKIEVLIGMAVIRVGANRPLENKAVLIDPAGSVVLSYTKAIPVPGFESRMSRRGQRVIQTSDSVFGRIAVAICFDMDFPAFIRQAGAAKADLLLVPASDWQAINRLHYIAAGFRAVENGVPLVRATRWGMSTAVDAQGRLLAQLDPFVSPSQAMVAQVPLGHTATIYSRFGDWFGWLCALGLMSLAAWRWWG
jgi:apolipoprotein N-acyltransferase